MRIDTDREVVVFDDGTELDFSLIEAVTITKPVFDALEERSVIRQHPDIRVTMRLVNGVTVADRDVFDITSAWRNIE